jgi:hypothetical protein
MKRPLAATLTACVCLFLLAFATAASGKRRLASVKNLMDPRRAKTGCDGNRANCGTFGVGFTDRFVSRFRSRHCLTSCAGDGGE